MGEADRPAVLEVPTTDELRDAARNLAGIFTDLGVTVAKAIGAAAGMLESVRRSHPEKFRGGHGSGMTPPSRVAKPPASSGTTPSPTAQSQ
jgi:hypothetical protein